jgi:hypothetical protein
MRIRIWIWIWNMSLFEHFFKGLSLYLEARFRDPGQQGENSDPDRNLQQIKIRIRINVKRILNTDPESEDRMLLFIILNLFRN